MTLTTTVPLLHSDAAAAAEPVPLPPLPPDRLLAIARGLGRDAATWRALAHHDRDERWHLRLSSNARFDIWLIGWHAHQGVELHDHGGSAGAFTVVEGELLETAGAVDGTDALLETRLSVGSARAFGPGHVHWVVNPAEQVATSVHVYSPPLVTMDYYETTQDLSFARVGTAPAIGPRTDVGEIRAGASSSARAWAAAVSAVDEVLERARARLLRIGPLEAAAAVRRGALLVDTRPLELRRRDGEIPGGHVVDRNVLEWRLDPTSAHRLPEADDPSRLVIVLCDEGYASSFAAVSLQDVGLFNATDLVGGFQAWRAAGLPVRAAAETDEFGATIPTS